MRHNSTSVFWLRKTPEQKKIVSHQQSAEREGGRKWNIHGENHVSCQASFHLIRLGPSLVSVLQAEVKQRQDAKLVKECKECFHKRLNPNQN